MTTNPPSDAASSPVQQKKLDALIAAARAGNGRASRKLGVLYRTGEGVEQDWDEAFRWYSLGASQGDAEAQNDLGTMFLGGLGCQEDASQAVFWYRKSAEQGNATAQSNLAERYLRGEGVAPDAEEAFKWYCAAAEQGDLESTYQVGTMYRFGRGVERNLLAAANFHVIAANGGVLAAHAALGEYLDELQDAALSGSQTASWFLALIHNGGLGVEPSQALTWTWLKWAKEHCAPSDHAAEAAEVDEMYAFAEWAIADDDQKEGERVLASLLEQRRPLRRRVAPDERGASGQRRGGTRTPAASRAAVGVNRKPKRAGGSPGRRKSRTGK